MIDKEKLYGLIEGTFGSDIRRYVDQPLNREQLKEEISKSIISYFPEISQHQEEKYGPLVRLSSNNSIEINMRRITAARWPELSDNERAKKYFIEQYGEGYYNNVDGVEFAPDGFGFSVRLKQPVDYIVIKLDTGDKVVKISTED